MDETADESVNPPTGLYRQVNQAQGGASCSGAAGAPVLAPGRSTWTGGSLLRSKTGIAVAAGNSVREPRSHASSYPAALCPPSRASIRRTNVGIKMGKISGYLAILLQYFLIIISFGGHPIRHLPVPPSNVPPADLNSREERPEQPYQPGREREERPKGQSRAATEPDPGEPQPGCHEEGGDRGTENHLRQRHGPDPGSRRREQLGVAVAQPLVAPQHSVQQRNHPQTEIAEGGSKRAVSQLLGIERDGGGEAGDDERQGQCIGQQPSAGVDATESAQPPAG